MGSKRRMLEIIGIIKKLHRENGWFEHILRKSNIDSPDFKIPYDTHWFEIMRPDGRTKLFSLTTLMEVTEILQVMGL